MMPGNYCGERFNKIFVSAARIVLFTFVVITGIHAHELKPVDPHDKHNMAAMSKDEMAEAKIVLPDGLSMLNQYGNNVDLRKNVIGDKIVAISFVYTTCTTVCPVVSSIFSMVQERLIERMGKDFALITITVDPARDTPHRLLSYSKSFNPASGWSWLTGDKKSVDKILSALGAYTPNFEDHPAMVLIGDDSNSEWYRYFGFPAPGVIVTKVNALLSKRSS